MDKNLEAAVMATYAELCVSWRMAHVAKLVKAEDLDAKLASLEGVIKAFDFSGSKAESSAPRPTPTPAKATAPRKAVQGAVVLED